MPIMPLNKHLQWNVVGQHSSDFVSIQIDSKMKEPTTDTKKKGCKVL